MPTVQSIISKGYFPVELPPYFNTEVYGNFLAANASALPSSFRDDKLISKSATHNLARRGTLRRELRIPNPINYYMLASFVVDNWTILERHASQSPFSLTTPVDAAYDRAIGRRCDFNERPKHMTRIRSTSRYILQTDINRFYHSIYTHCIPWAICGKSAAKANRSPDLLGNKLDMLVRNAQDGQTLGIPVGPDTSLLVAEIILSAADVVLSNKGITNGFRYMDDYEFGFPNYAEAEQSLGTLQEVLNTYELALNPKKTQITNLPKPTEAFSISELRTFIFRSTQVAQHSDILRYFDRAFSFFEENPEDEILQYAVSRLMGETIHQDNWTLCENLLLQCAIVEPGAIRFVLKQFLKYKELSYLLNFDRIGETFNRVITQHAPLGHSSEVAWAIWGLLAMNISMQANSASAASSMNDSVVAILVLDANSKNLIPSGTDFGNYQSLMTTDDLYGEHWLVAYEANAKGWLPSVGQKDHVNADERFSILKANGVYFYDDSRALYIAQVEGY